MRALYPGQKTRKALYFTSIDQLWELSAEASPFPDFNGNSDDVVPIAETAVELASGVHARQLTRSA